MKRLYSKYSSSNAAVPPRIYKLLFLASVTVGMSACCTTINSHGLFNAADRHYVCGFAKNTKTLRPITFARVAVLDITPKSSIFGLASLKEFGQGRTDRNGRFKIAIEDPKKFTKIQNHPNIGLEIFSADLKAKFQQLQLGLEPTYLFEMLPY